MASLDKTARSPPQRLHLQLGEISHFNLRTKKNENTSSASLLHEAADGHVNLSADGDVLIGKVCGAG